MNILYLHGMGSGSHTSRVANKLRTELPKKQFTKGGEPCTLNLICETYDFDPEVATKQIAGWVETYQPVLVIGESMGSIHALGIQGIPHIYISPALNYDRGTEFFKPLMTLANLIGYKYTSQRGKQRQKIDGDPELLAKFRPMIQSYKEAILSSPQRDPSFAFFGSHDKYMMSGIVSIKEYERLYGDSYEVHEGGHIFGANYVKPKLLPKIAEMLGLEEINPPRRRRKKQE